MGYLRNDGENRQLGIRIQPNIGLNGEAHHSFVAILNTTMADEAVLTLKTNSAHWHIAVLDIQV